jgi:hypothetical protein
MGITDFTKYFGFGAKPSPKIQMPEINREELMFKQFGAKQNLLEWRAPSRLHHKQLNARFLRMFMIIGIVVGILLALMQDFGLIIVIGSLIFFYYALNNKYTPTEVEYQITNYGIKYGTEFYYWPDLRRFFFSRKGSDELLAIDTTLGIPGRLIVVFPAELREKIVEILKQYIAYIDVEPKSSLDKFFEGILSKLNFEEK